MQRLGDIAKITAGQAAPKDFSINGYPFIRAGHLDELLLGKKLDELPKVSIDVANKSGLKLIPKGTILFAKSGMSATKNRVYITDSDSYFVSHLAGILPSHKFVNSFLARYLSWYNMSNLILDSAYPSIRLEDINNLQIPLPPLEQQKKIAAILDAADAYRQKTKALIAKYDELTQSLFLDMFGDPVKNGKGWEFTEIENIARKDKNSIKAGPFGSSLKKEFYVAEGYKIYGQEQVIKDDLTFGNYYIDENKYKELESCKVQSGDILISLVGTYGKISIVPEKFEAGIINPRLMKLSPNNKIIRSDFLKFLLQSEFVARQLKTQSRGGTMDIINVGIIKKVKIPLPSISLQNQFAERVQAIEEQKAQAKASLEKAENLFNSLLQRAFKGELV